MAIRSLSSLQGALSKARAGWEPAEAFLSVDELDARLGLTPDPAEMKATQSASRAANAAARSLSAVAAPAAIDWRNNGGNFVTPIRDQMSCGSCVSFATVATIEARLNIVCRTPGTNRDLAEADLFYCGCGNCCANGWNFPPALDYCRNTGVAPESAFPYTPGNQPCKPNLVPKTKISAWSARLGIAERKDTIAQKGPVVAGMAVFEDFNYYRSGVYRHVSGVLRGYHAVSVVGYDDARGCWIAKNSWGPGWGENGFFNIAYGQCEIDTSFAFYSVDVACPQPPAPVDDCDSHLPYLRKVLVAARDNRRLRACLLYWICGSRQTPPPRCSPSIDAVVARVAKILRLCPRFRRPFCAALSS